MAEIYVHGRFTQVSDHVHADQPMEKESFSLSLPMDYRDDRL